MQEFPHRPAAQSNISIYFSQEYSETSSCMDTCELQIEKHTYRNSILVFTFTLLSNQLQCPADLLLQEYRDILRSRYPSLSKSERIGSATQAHGIPRQLKTLLSLYTITLNATSNPIQQGTDRAHYHRVSTLFPYPSRVS